MKVLIVLHHEIMGMAGNYRDDEMVKYVVTSMEKAIQCIKKSGGVPWSWWEIQEQTLDDPEYNWPEHVGYYGLRGGKLQKQPSFTKFVEIFKSKS